jgi:hypothetical protein
VDIFSPESCMGKNCRNVPKETLCCSLKNQDSNIYSEYELKELVDYCQSNENELLSILGMFSVFIVILGSILCIMGLIAGIKLFIDKNETKKQFLMS